jgi:hypothetical protein
LFAGAKVEIKKPDVKERKKERLRRKFVESERVLLEEGGDSTTFISPRVLQDEGRLEKQAFGLSATFNNIHTLMRLCLMGNNDIFTIVVLRDDRVADQAGGAPKSRNAALATLTRDI